MSFYNLAELNTCRLCFADSLVDLHRRKESSRIWKICGSYLGQTWVCFFVVFLSSMNTGSHSVAMVCSRPIRFTSFPQQNNNAVLRQRTINISSVFFDFSCLPAAHACSLEWTLPATWRHCFVCWNVSVRLITLAPMRSVFGMFTSLLFITFRWVYLYSYFVCYKYIEAAP
jgi:hypothetical protein